MDTHTLAIKLVCGLESENEHQGYISEARIAGRLLIIESLYTIEDNALCIDWGV